MNVLLSFLMILVRVTSEQALFLNSMWNVKYKCQQTLQGQNKSSVLNLQIRLEWPSTLV